MNLAQFQEWWRGGVPEPAVSPIDPRLAAIPPETDGIPYLAWKARHGGAIDPRTQAERDADYARHQTTQRPANGNHK